MFRVPHAHSHHGIISNAPMHSFLLVNETSERDPVEPELEEGEEETVVETEATQGKQLSMLKYLLLQNTYINYELWVALGYIYVLPSRSYLMH